MIYYWPPFDKGGSEGGFMIKVESSAL
ncbi:MAG: hypothetical protein ACD_2C00185G0008, partial [uncultured bacterium (gcode 4)]